MFALRKDGVVLKTHPTKLACVVEAIERKLVVEWSPDFDGDGRGVSLAAGVDIVEVVEDE